MKKIFLIGLVVAIAASGCVKNDLKQSCEPETATASPAEVAALKAYLDSAAITYVQDPRGFFFRIEPAGTGAKPTVCSNITVNYTGTLVSGTTFDQQNDISFSLYNTIPGWREGIPLLNAGGTIYLYIPPSLAYGSGGQPGIPANSNLFFKVELLAVN